MAPGTPLRFVVAGVTLSAPQARFAWQPGRLCTCTDSDVRGSVLRFAGRLARSCGNSQINEVYATVRWQT